MPRRKKGVMELSVWLNFNHAVEFYAPVGPSEFLAPFKAAIMNRARSLTSFALVASRNSTEWHAVGCRFRVT